MWKKPVRKRGSAPAGQRRLLRGLVALAVALGLVGMHGLGRSAVLGCHGPAPEHAQHSVVHGSQAKPQDPGPHWDGDEHAVLSGDVCQPLLPGWPSWLPLLICIALLPLAALLTLGANFLRAERSDLGSWWRAPPRAGRVCLLRVCVHRT